MWPAASEPCARMFEQRLRGHGLWRPLQQPHTRTAYRKSEKGHGRVTSWKIHCTLAKSSDGGWRQWSSAGRRRLEATKHPPINTHAEHDLLPATRLGGGDGSSQSQKPSRASRCDSVRGRARLASFCKATAAIADSVRSSVRPRTNDLRARAKRSRPSRSVCL
jgi:hypothetical protein